MSRTKRVATLFVGEFATADASLISAIRAAFAAASSEGSIPTGDEFLRYFAARGCRLAGLVERPDAERSPGERRAALASGVPELAQLIAAVRPRRIVVVKADIAPYVEEAVSVAGAKSVSVLALRYPLRQWRAVFIR